MHTLLLAVLALTAESNAPLPPFPSMEGLSPHEPVAVFADDAFMLPAEHAGPAGWGLSPLQSPSGRAWARTARPRLPRLSAVWDYHQTHAYDPRLMLDYPWHAPRVRPPALPHGIPPRGAYEF